MGPLTDAAPTTRLAVRADEDVGAARRTVSQLAAWVPSVRRSDVELIVTELATNIVRHTSAGGYLLCQPIPDGIEVVAVDHGPGLPPGTMRTSAAAGPAPIARAGSLGVGLGSVVRLSTSLDYYTDERGTVIVSRVGAYGDQGVGWCRWAGLNVALQGQVESGDGWAVAVDGRLSALLVDGLGHGPGAAAASRAALGVFDHRRPGDLEAFVREAHEAMQGTRGGVLGLAVIDPDRNELRYAGVGNVFGRVAAGEQHRSLFGRDGAVGTQLKPPHIHVAQYPWPPGATLVMASDGMSWHWALEDYPGLLDHDPTVIAATLHRDHGRNTDDVTVVVVGDRRDEMR